MTVKTLSQNKQGMDLLIEHAGKNDSKKLDSLKMLNMFKSGTPSLKVLNKLAEFDKSDAIFILRNWISSHYDNSGSLDLAEHLISLIISTPEYHSNATIYSDIIKVLPTLKANDGKKLISNIVPKIKALSLVGPSLDYYNVIIEMSKFEKSNGLSLSISNNLFYEIIEKIEDSSAKVSALLLLLKDCTYEKLELNKAKIEDEIEKLIDSLLCDTAEHIIILEPLLKSMAHINFFQAVKWTQQANTQIRRDALLNTLIKTVYESNIELEVGSLTSVIRKIKDIDLKSDAIRCFFKYCLTKPIDKKRFKELCKLRNKSKHNVLKTILNSYLINITFNNVEVLSTQLETTKKELKESWTGIVGDWNKIDAAFKVHNDLYDVNKELASEYKSLAISLRQETSSINNTLLSSYFYSLDLVIRAIYEYLKRDIRVDDQIQVLTELIENIPNSILKLKTLSRFASMFYLVKNIGEFEQVVRNKIVPLLDEFGNSYTKEFAAAFELAAPVLYCFSQNLFEKKWAVLHTDPVLADDILSDVLNFKLRKSLLYDPFKPVANKHFDIHPEELEDYLYLINHLKEDSKIYHMMETVLNHALSRKNCHNFSSSQLESFKNTIEVTVHDKLGKYQYIKHDGYKICCTALIYKITNEKQKCKWEELLIQAKAIPCCSDKVFTIGQLICLMPSNFTAEKRKYLKESALYIKNIPSKVEQLSRAEFIVEIGQDIDTHFIKNFIKEVISIREDEENGEFNSKRLGFIDSVYAMDENFAGSLSSVFDNDPARKKAIDKTIERKNNQINDRKSLSYEDKALEDSEKVTKFANMFWLQLGQLNAQNHTPNKKQNLSQLICSISNHGLTKVYPIFSYLIHSVSTTTISPKKSDLQNNLEPFLTSFLGGAIQFSNMFALASSNTQKIVNANHLLVDKFNINEARNFISSWVLDNTKELDEPELFIVEPYFELDDLDLLAEVTNKDPNFRINILSSIDRFNQIEEVHGDISSAVKRYWKQNVNDDELPLITLTFIGLDSLEMQMPIHDRWWYLNKTGLDLGTSINGIGSMRLSMLKQLNYEQVITIQEKVDCFFNRSKRKIKAEKVQYELRLIQ